MNCAPSARANLGNYMINSMPSFNSLNFFNPLKGAGGVFAARWPLRLFTMLLSALLVVTSGCSGRKPKAQQREFFTSGSKEADQRASQRMAKEEQLTGTGEGGGEKGVKKAKPADGSPSAAS